MDRTGFLQRLLDRREDTSYLEIGVYRGENFLKIRAAKKFAVDPALRISLRTKIASLCRNPSNARNKYYEMTSDEFFAQHADDLPKQGLDVVFIDGLHTYKQALRDTEHALRHLKRDGTIVLHDCNPPHRAAATPANSVQEAHALNVPGWDGRWCGDVWKVILHLRSQRDDLTTCVVDCDMGLGVVRRGANAKRLSFDVNQMASLKYSDLERNRNAWLNLCSPESVLDS